MTQNDQMKTLSITLLFTMFLFTACGETVSNQAANADGFAAIENNLKSQFGENAFYTDLSITKNPEIGNIITTTVTKEPESLKMGQWTQAADAWEQTADVTLEVPKGTQAADFMFQLGEEVSLRELGALVEKSKADLAQEKNLDEPRLHVAMVKFPDTGDFGKAEYVVMLKPKTGGTTFTYSYSLDGKRLSMAN